MGDEKNTNVPTSLDSTKPQYSLSTNHNIKSSNESRKPVYESDKSGTNKSRYNDSSKKKD